MADDRIKSHWPAPSKDGPDFKPSREPQADGWWIENGDWAQIENGQLVIYRQPPILENTDNPDLSRCLVNWSN